MTIQAVTMIWYRREDYGRLLTIFEDAKNLPATFDEWITQAEHGKAFLRNSGKRVVRVVIDPDEFTAWCVAKKMKLDSHARKQFALLKAPTILAREN